MQLCNILIYPKYLPSFLITNTISKSFPPLKSSIPSFTIHFCFLNKSISSAPKSHAHAEIFSGSSPSTKYICRWVEREIKSAPSFTHYKVLNNPAAGSDSTWLEQCRAISILYLGTGPLGMPGRSLHSFLHSHTCPALQSALGKRPGPLHTRQAATYGQRCSPHRYGQKARRERVPPFTGHSFSGGRRRPKEKAQAERPWQGRTCRPRIEEHAAARKRGRETGQDRRKRNNKEKTTAPQSRDRRAPRGTSVPPLAQFKSGLATAAVTAAAAALLGGPRGGSAHARGAREEPLRRSVRETAFVRPPAMSSCPACWGESGSFQPGVWHGVRWCQRGRMFSVETVRNFAKRVSCGSQGRAPQTGSAMNTLGSRATGNAVLLRESRKSKWRVSKCKECCVWSENPTKVQSTHPTQGLLTGDTMSGLSHYPLSTSSTIMSFGGTAEAAAPGNVSAVRPNQTFPWGLWPKLQEPHGKFQCSRHSCQPSSSAPAFLSVLLWFPLTCPHQGGIS